MKYIEINSKIWDTRAENNDVTVLDNSKKQLEKDEFVADRDNLKIKTVQGNMQENRKRCERDGREIRTSVLKILYKPGALCYNQNCS